MSGGDESLHAGDDAGRELELQRARVRDATRRVQDDDRPADERALAAQDAAAAATDAVAALDRLARERGRDAPAGG